MITAKVIADSLNEFGDRITTMVVTFPRIVLAELNTHRMFSRNSASSRAIPFKKMVKMVEENPFIPIALQKDHKGMQGTEYLTGYDELRAIENHRQAMRYAINQANYQNDLGVTKQLCNRLLESFMYHTAIITATEWENFFALRCPKYEIFVGPIDTEEYACRGKSWKELMDSNNGLARDFDTDNVLERLSYNKGQAEIHMMALAETMYDAMNESTPKELKVGKWHIPFGDKIDEERLMNETMDEMFPNKTELNKAIQFQKVQIATARCARVSYLNYEGKDDYEADIDLCKSLIERPYTNKKGFTFTYDDPVHASPAEHCAKTMGVDDFDNYFRIDNGIVESGWCKNFRGFMQFRHIIEQNK